MDLDIEKVRLLRYDGDFRSPHRIQRRCSVSSQWKRRGRVICYVTVVVALLGGLIVLLPIKEGIVAISTWIDHHHTWGAVLLPLMFCVAIPLAIPATMLEILSGSAFGLFGGILLNVIGKTCGAVVAFLVGKRLGKERLGSYLQTNFPLFSALSSVVEGPNWKPLVLIQLSSIPPVVKCYGLSVMGISLPRFAITAMIGGVPNAVLWSYIGFQTKDLIANANAPDTSSTDTSSGSRWALVMLGLLFTVLAMASLFVYTRRELNAQLQQAKKKEAASSDEEELLIMEDARVVVTQVSNSDPSQQIAKRTSVG